MKNQGKQTEPFEPRSVLCISLLLFVWFCIGLLLLVWYCISLILFTWLCISLPLFVWLCTKQFHDLVNTSHACKIQSDVSSWKLDLVPLFPVKNNPLPISGWYTSRSCCKWPNILGICCYEDQTRRVWGPDCNSLHGIDAGEGHTCMRSLAGRKARGDSTPWPVFTFYCFR